MCGMNALHLQGKCTSQDQQNVKLYRMRLGKVSLGVKRNYKHSHCEMWCLTLELKVFLKPFIERNTNTNTYKGY